MAGGHQNAVILLRDPDGESKIAPLWRVTVMHPPGGGAVEIATVPHRFEWHILNIWVEYTTPDDQAGVRQLVVECQDPNGNIIAQQRARATQAANTTRLYNFGPSLAENDAFYDTDFLTTPIPPTWILPPRYNIRTYDNNIASAADVNDTRLLIARRIVL